jgi:hypothetical protein
VVLLNSLLRESSPPKWEERPRRGEEVVYVDTKERSTPERKGTGSAKDLGPEHGMCRSEQVRGEKW